MVDAPTSVTTPQTSTSQTNATDTGSATQISADFETFLQMLTAQLENQDPLNPLESTEFAEQLATFSGVEQQVLTNDLLKDLNSQMSTSGMADMAGWVGMEARAIAPVYYDGTRSVTLSPNPLAVADQAQLVVRDQYGSEVQRMEIPVTGENYEWDGRDAGGTPLPLGTYSFEITSFSQGEELSTDPVEVYQRVDEIRTDGQGTILLLQGGSQILTDTVTALRDPDATA